ncbi:hypothetical protein E6C27_scaffold4837G00010 [Cucumis melo var. makuwa]|uniref:Uncharacterized protein n=1 Tax=Cucumis melo var. makuwa TaxID=1194695 RepID=A0A5A7UUJ5_CUCMM|nr:hypothetical protein E6C27_scaffold4837G00010 [Cucumis melo var. makuwa]
MMHSIMWNCPRWATLQETSALPELGVGEIHIEEWEDPNLHRPKSEEANLVTCCSVQQYHCCINMDTFSVRCLKWVDVPSEYIKVVKGDLQLIL